MIVYYVNLFFIAIYMALGNIFKKNWKIFFLIVSFVQLFILLILRKLSIGKDVIGYVNLFQRSKFYSVYDFSYSRFERGYLALNKMLNFINNDRVFIGIIGFLILILFYNVIKKESKMPLLSIYLFITLGFYTNTYNILRQIIAIGIVFNSYKYLKTSSYKSFFFCIIVASSFHISSLIFLGVYIIRNRKIDIVNIFKYFIVSLLIYNFSEKILKLILFKFSNIQYEIASKGGFSLLVLLILIFITSLILKKGLLKKDYNNKILLNILIAGILVQILALKFSLFTRVTSYFTVFLILLIPEMLYAIKNTYIRSIGIMLIIILTAIQYYLALNVDLSGITPYEFYFK